MDSETFSCPKCGAPLEYKGGKDFTFPCPFCGNSVIVPENLRTPLSGTLNQQPASPGKADEKAVLQLLQDLLKAGKKDAAVLLYEFAYHSKGFSEAKKVIDGIKAGTVVELPSVEVDQHTLDQFTKELRGK
jgi:endogenous inhibitor of DNA gyrase (YacG/DUF329 family)